MLTRANLVVKTAVRMRVLGEDPAPTRQVLMGAAEVSAGGLGVTSPVTGYVEF